jgi:CDP-diacylglycerol--serine O-phosphatidyltransferase
VILAVAFLMVSTWRFYSFKDLNLSSRRPFWVLIVICLILYSVIFFSRYVLFTVAISYMLSGVISRLSFTFRRRPSEPTPPAYEEAPEPR